MIDPRRSARWRLSFVTTGIVSLAAAAAVGWAAATPVGTAATSPAPVVSSPSQSAQQVAAARTNLQQVRRDLARILAGEDDLPRVSIANIPTVQVPSVQLPAAGTSTPTVQTAPPVTHTTTGASGVVVP